MWKRLAVAVLLVTACVAVAHADNLNTDDTINDNHNGPGRGDGNGRVVRGRGKFVGYDTVEPRVSNDVFIVEADLYDDYEILPGVNISKACAVILDNLSWQLQMNGQKTRCPKGPFGALIVNFTDTTGNVTDQFGNSCGRIVGSNSGLRDATDPSAHSEIDAIRREGFGKPGHRFDLSLWSQLSMITSGASCPMDTTAELYAGMKAQLYSLSVDDLVKLNYSQIALEPEQIIGKSATLPGDRMILVKSVNPGPNIQRYGWRNIVTNPCPPGCQRVTPNALCSDITPWVFDPATMTIPDLNYPAPSTSFKLN